MEPVTGAHGVGARWRLRRSEMALVNQPGYAGSRFADVWRVIAADAYDALPDKRLRLTTVSEHYAKQLYASSRRTLTQRDDLLPPFDKLVHPAGICLRGSWRITAETPYTGLFKTGAQGLIIARASDALGECRPGRLRMMGLAGKLYPTTDPDHAEPLPTANFFTLENIAGSHTPQFAAATLSNDLLPLRPQPDPEAVFKAPTGAVAGAAIALADRALNPAQAAIRQLYPIAELGEDDPAAAKGPVVMRLAGAARNRRVETADLREELNMKYHPEGIRFELLVADRRSFLMPRGFRAIGEIHLTESVASYSGDHRLHFAHPPYRRSRLLALALARGERRILSLPMPRRIRERMARAR